MWEDYVLTLVIVVFAFALLPMIFDKYTPPYKTSIVNSIGAVILAFVNVSLGLYIAFWIQIVVACLWLILIFQRVKNKQ